MHQGIHHGFDDVVKFKTIAQPARPLAIPPIVSGTLDKAGRKVFTIEAQAGETSIKEGPMTRTYGYNGSVLGPVLSLKRGDRVSIQLKNTLLEDTTFHWHGLVVPSDVDGGPHHPLAANGGTGQIDFTVNQGASTAWFHPHAMGTTASQVYQGLAGLIRIEDEALDGLHLPYTYGVDDIPVVLQDRNFTDDNQWQYGADYEADGVYGDTLLVNGTINPYLKVTSNLIRLRVLNGSNARNYLLALNNGATMQQIATDSGLLNSPVTLSALTLVPGERAEIVLDFSKYEGLLPKLVTEDGTVVLDFKRGAMGDMGATLPQWQRTEGTTLTTANWQAAMAAKADKTVVMAGMANDVTINGKKFSMDRIDLTSQLGSTEIWDITNADSAMMGMMHPFHIHGVQFEVVSRNGKAVTPKERGLKDTIQVNPGETVRIKVHFTEPGVFMVHCHILEHEENGMMIQLLVK
ncbi:multicopper oxidase family protein [Veillonella sp. R32]|uniref:multicopper oxidase family protein n=1 Tax=Veillonella sp. R32 TaxID=2021312 RepID=UPI00138A2E8F|nr:multicopper oxidase domain-containing protein [Veillonella sp. R32]